MDSIFPSCHFYGNLLEGQSHRHRFTTSSFSSCNTTTTKRNVSYPVRVTALNRSKVGHHHHNHRKLVPKHLRYPRRGKLPQDPKSNLFFKKKKHHIATDPLSPTDSNFNGPSNIDAEDEDDECLEWSPDEIDAISSLFQGRIPQKPGSLYRVRPLPLPLPYKLRPLGLPTPKKHVRMASSVMTSSRTSVCNRVYKNPEFLIYLAKEIGSLPSDKDVSEVLEKWARFLRKGSLSLTIRELGHMDLPERALQTFHWAGKQSHLFPDDRILASTLEILARTQRLQKPFDLHNFVTSASRGVIEAMARGCIRGGSINLARKLLLMAKDCNRTLDASIHAKLILEVGKNPDKFKLALVLLDELAEREDFNLSQQDCTAVMKVCIRLKKFEIVESLFNWFKASRRHPSVVMYTTLIHSRYSEKNYRDALALVWEMEESNCLLDLPAYRVTIKLFVALNDLPRAIRYYSRLKEAGLTATFDIYRDMFNIYAVAGRLAKCKEVCKEIEKAGFTLDKQMESLMLQMGR